MDIRANWSVLANRAQHLLRLFFSPDDKVLSLPASIEMETFILSSAPPVRLRRVATGDSGRQPFTRIAFSPDSGRLATVAFGLGPGGGPDPVLIWEIATGRHLASFPGRAEAVGSLVIHARRSIVADLEQGERSPLAH